MKKIKRKPNIIFAIKHASIMNSKNARTTIYIFD